MQRKKTGTHKSSPSRTRSKTASAKRVKQQKRAARRAGGNAAEALPDKVRTLARTRQLQETKTAAEAAIEAALDKKALLPVLLDVSARASYTDFIGIVSGRSDRQVEAIAENVIRTLNARGWQLLGREGNGNGRWTLLDFGDIVLHVFFHPVREFYDIESLWIDAPRIKLKVPPEATQLREETLFYEQP